jgi:hypothetical protein
MLEWLRKMRDMLSPGFFRALHLILVTVPTVRPWGPDLLGADVCLARSSASSRLKNKGYDPVLVITEVVV